MTIVSRAFLSVVEIGGNPTLLIVGGLFIVIFISVCAIGYALLANRRIDAPPSTLKVQLQSRLPVSKRTFDQVARAASAAMARPEINPVVRDQLNQLDQVRGVFVSIYGVVMIVVGLAGLAGGVLLLRSHTPANMQGLPGAIILLFSLGALLKGLMPGPSIMPSNEPLDSLLLDQLKQKGSVQVSTSQPLTVTLSESDMRLATQMLRQGVPIADVARAVHQGYVGLSDLDKRSVESSIAQATGAGDY